MKFFRSLKRCHSEEDAVHDIEEDEERPVENIARASDAVAEAIDEIEWAIWMGNQPRRKMSGRDS